MSLHHTSLKMESNYPPQINPPDIPIQLPVMQISPTQANKLKKNSHRKIGKREMRRVLEEENTQLKYQINSLQQQISAVEAQNKLLKTQLNFFNSSNMDNQPQFTNQC